VRPSNRNLFAAEDSQKVAAIGTAQRLNLPKFTITPGQDAALNAHSKFVGVWSSKRGWANGKGRYGMLIITEVSATGLASGYYLWGPPTKVSWVQDPAGYRWFAEYIVNDTISINVKPVIKAKLGNKNTLTLSTAKADKPSEKSSIELQPVWQLVARTRDAAEPSGERGQPARKPKETSTAHPAPAEARLRESSPARSEPAENPQRPAEAPVGDSRCNNMRDKLGCLCAVRNGGGISADGKRWYSKRRGTDLTNEAFVQCQIRAGRT
jgi:hypothetical protein